MLIKTAKLNGVDPQNWFADVLARLPDNPARRTDNLMPWRSKAPSQVIAAWRKLPRRTSSLAFRGRVRK
jgi:transposase